MSHEARELPFNVLVALNLSDSNSVLHPRESSCGSSKRCPWNLHALVIDTGSWDPPGRQGARSRHRRTGERTRPSGGGHNAVENEAETPISCGTPRRLAVGGEAFRHDGDRLVPVPLPVSPPRPDPPASDYYWCPPRRRTRVPSRGWIRDQHLWPLAITRTRQWIDERLATEESSASVRPSVRPSICLSSCLFDCLSVCLSVCLPRCIYSSSCLIA